MPVTIRGAGIVLLGYKFGINRTFPTPGEDGDEMSFAFDGATITPGELVADSGSRTVDIELTLASAAITSGTLAALAIFTTDTAFDGDTEGMAITYSASPTFLVTESNFSGVMPLLIITAADGHAKTTLTITNAEAEGYSTYLTVFLPTGGVASSAEIAIPALVE